MDNQRRTDSIIADNPLDCLQNSWEIARFNIDRYHTWIEKDYCSQPLAIEREADLNRFFGDINVKVVSSEVDGGAKLGIDNPFGL